MHKRTKITLKLNFEAREKILGGEGGGASLNSNFGVALPPSHPLASLLLKPCGIMWEYKSDSDKLSFIVILKAHKTIGKPET